MVITPFAWYVIAVSPWIRVLRHWGGLGLLVLGLVGSVLPLPGGIEIATVVLSARHHDPWWYYGLMATAGSCLSGAIFYYLGWTGGTQLLGKRIPAKQVTVWMDRLRTWGFGVVVLSGLIPPPIPTTPMLMAAGAVHYPRERFASALVLGRAVRFMLLALAGHIYRRRAVAMVNRAVLPLVVIMLVGMAVYGVIMWQRLRRQRHESAAPLELAAQPPAEADGTSARPVITLSQGSVV
jgi:membrane protein YqaA with SNARE-associated domain